jgi:hypothetical protein
MNLSRAFVSLPDAAEGRLALVVLACGLLLMAPACGGKVMSDPSSDAAVPPLDGPLPTCSTICRRLVDLCSFSPSAACVDSCENTIKGFASCTAELDTFLFFMARTRVQCEAGNNVVIVDCSEERSELETCR